ncbi:MAG: hypothetical protein JO069_02575 [Verrucomicrobia bacterium]|nr:hypothetical protein [Verrucomicrobiota bacterium]
MRSYAVIYVPYYRLQCAFLKRLLSSRGSPAELPAAEDFLFSLSSSSLSSQTSAWTELHERLPAALLDDRGECVVELNPPAEAAGIPLRVHTSLAVARAPALLCLPRALSWEDQVQEAVLQLAARYSSLLEDTAPGVCTLDLRRWRDAHHPGPCLKDLLGQLRRLGLRAKVGLGAHPQMALQAAKIADPLLEIAENDCFLLQALPIESLAPSSELRALLHSWGVYTLGELIRLPREGIAQRLGPEGLSLWDRAAGRSPQVLRYMRPSERYFESVELEYRIETLESLLFLIRRFLERLSFRITAGYRLVAELCLTLRLENQESLARTLLIPAPTGDVETLFRIVSQYLETVQTAAPVVGLTLEAKPSDPGCHQFDLLQGSLKDPNRFFQTLARLAALVGNGGVGIPELLDTHRPDSVRLRWPDGRWVPVPSSSSPPGQNGKISPRVGLALRRCRPGAPASVTLVGGRPARIQSLLVTGSIRAVHGPWKLSGNWWDRSFFWAVEEWDVQLQEGGLYRLARTGKQWQLVGVYD